MHAYVVLRASQRNQAVCVILRVSVDLIASTARIALMRDGLLRMSLEDFQGGARAFNKRGIFHV
jgi:hypothetical protein